MQDIIHYTQQKGKKNISFCELNLYVENNTIFYNSKFKLGNSEWGFILQINLRTGNIFTNDGRNESYKKNDFNRIETTTTFGFYCGAVNENYWGIKYKKITQSIFDTIKDEIFRNTTDSFIISKTYKTTVKNPLYDLIVDFHLTKNKIKFHNNVYCHIQEFYPSQKFLKLNDRKFLPSILDQKGIKSKYLIGQLSSDENKEIKIKSLTYFCNLFGDNFIDYIKKTDWKKICSYSISGTHKHVCVNDHDKKTLIDLILSQGIDIKNIIDEIYRIFDLKSFIDKSEYGFILKLRKTDSIQMTIEKLSLLKKRIKSGFMWKCDIPKDLINFIEQPIVINDHRFIPKVLLYQDDFIMEGIRMKNCMQKHFFNAVICNYISLSLDNKRINLEYHKGVLLKSYGKANTLVDMDIFGDAIHELNNRMETCGNIPIKKERVDLIKK